MAVARAGGRGVFLFGRFGGGSFEHGADDGVGPVGGQALQAGLPGFGVEVLEVVIRVVGRNIDGFGDGGVYEGLHGLHHGDVLFGGHGQGIDEVVGQVADVAALRLVEAPGVVFHLVFAAGAVGFALFAGVGPGKGRLDAVGGVVGKGQADGAGGGDGQQVAVADAVLADGVLNVLRQAAGEGALAQVLGGVKAGESAFFLGQFDGGAVGGVSHGFGDAGGHLAAFVAVIAQAQHGQRVAQARKAHANAALGGGFGALLLQRPEGDIQHVVQRAHLGGDDFFKGVEVKHRLAAFAKGVAHEAGEDDGAKIAAAVGRQGLLAAGVGGLDGFAVVEVVVAADGVDEQDARLGEVVGGLHDGVPQLAGRQALVNPQAVLPLVAAGFAQGGSGARLVHQLPVGVFLQRLHEGVGHADGNVEIVPAAGRALGGDEVEHIRVVDAQHAHLRATAAARALHGGAALVKHVDVAARAGSDGSGALDLGPAGADAREVIAHAAAAPHGFGRFAQGFVNAGVAIVGHALDGVAHGLHEAVDERGLNVGARRAHDAPRANGACLEVGQEFGFPFGAQRGFFGGGQGARHAGEELVFGFFFFLEIFLGQHVLADGLHGQFQPAGGDVFMFHGRSKQQGGNKRAFCAHGVKNGRGEEKGASAGPGQPVALKDWRAGRACQLEAARRGKFWHRGSSFFDSSKGRQAGRLRHFALLPKNGLQNATRYVKARVGHQKEGCHRGLQEPARRLACGCRRRLPALQKQEQIQGIKNAPIARFDGLCCYQTSSKKAKSLQGAAAVKTGSRPGRERVASQSRSVSGFLRACKKKPAAAGLLGPYLNLGRLNCGGTPRRVLMIHCWAMVRMLLVIQ